MVVIVNQGYLSEHNNFVDPTSEKSPFALKHITKNEHVSS